MRTIPASELIINDDGSIFHLHLRPGQLADTVILVGDPGRVALVAEYFDSRATSTSASRSWTRWPTSISPRGRRGAKNAV